MAERTNSSILWHHFHKDDDTGKAVCNICEDSISYKSTTANLKSHLKRKHISTYSSMFPSDESVNKLLEKSSKRRLKRRQIPTCSSTISSEESSGKIRKNSSSLWHYFYKNDETRKAECNICEESISFKSTTANLKSHLRRKHFSTYSSMISSEEPSEIRKHDHQPKNRVFDDTMEIKDDDNCNISKDDHGNRASSSATTQALDIKQRQSDMDYYVSKKKSLQQKKQIDADLLDLFIDGFHSFSLVDERAFKKFVRWIPGYKLPTRETISNSMLDELYLKTLENVREQVNAEIEQLSITCDLWTSRAYESFIAVTGHYINRDFESKTVLLGCQQFDGEHNTGWNIASELRSILDHWNLRDRVNLVVSENAINIGIAIQELLGYQHFVCYAHTLDLIVSDALALFKESLDKAKMIVQHFRKSSVSSEKLTKFQVDQDKVPKQLVQQKDLSWNSTFLMLSSLVEIEVAVRSTLGLVDVNLPVISEEEWIAFSSLCQILKPFESVTSLMSGEKYLTGSLVIVTTRCLKESCNKMLAKNNLPFIIKDIVTALKFGLENRFKNIEQSSTFAICTFLDPRFKMQAFSDQREGEKTKAIITELVVRTIEKSYRTEEMAEGDSTTYEEEDNLWTILDNFVEKNIARVTPLSKAIKEVDMYLADEVLARKNKNGEWNCPLQWWRNHRLVYPNLAELYIQKCNIVATSVPCQRMFSKTGNIIADRRTRLTTKKVEKLMFLNVNLCDTRFKNYM